MKKIVIYPFNNDSRVILENQELIMEFEIMAVMLPKGFRSTVDKECEMYGVPCTTEYEDVIDCSDACIFFDNTLNYELDGYKRRMAYAMRRKKGLYLSSILYEQISDDFFAGYPITLLNTNWIEEPYETDTLFNIQAPVVPIMGLGENTDKFALQVEFTKRIKDMNYKVLSVTANPAGGILGLKPLPPSIFSKEKALPLKILEFNHLLHRLELRERPDVILIGCPAGIMPINKYSSNFYGEIPYIITNAVVCDTAILNTYYVEKLEDDTLEDFSIYCQNRFNVSPEYFIISRQICDTNFEKKSVEFRFLQENSIKEHFNMAECQQHSITLYQDIEKRNRIFDEIIRGFEEGINIV